MQLKLRIFCRYSYNAVHFALRHIYSGESNIPDCISIVELATLADMLCLEGLKEVIGYTLKVKYCHLFHKVNIAFYHVPNLIYIYSINMHKIVSLAKYVLLEFWSVCH